MPRAPWFAPYLKAGARGSTQTAGAWCERNRCAYCDQVRRTPIDEPHTSRYWLAAL